MSLDAFLDHYYKECTKNQLDDYPYTKELESAVKEIVWKIIQKGLSLKVKDVITGSASSEQPVLFEGTFQDILPVCRLVPLGSAYEGTRVGNPFEYDFMLEIDVDVEVEAGCGSGYVKVKYPPDRNWRDLPSDRLLRASDVEEQEYPSLDCIFSTLVNVLTRDDIIMSKEEKKVQTSSGTLKALPSGSYFHIACLWNDGSGDENVVSIDLRPAFRYPKKEIDKEDVKGCFPENMTDFIKDHSIYLVPKGCVTSSCTQCFLTSFATCEMKLMQIMDDNHRKCYVILKNMVSPKDSYEDSLTEVTSYHVKTCLLNHVYGTCHLKCEKQSTGNCVISILQLLTESVKDMKLPTFFRPELSVFQRSSHTSYKIDFLIPVNSDLAKILNDNGDEEDIIPTLTYLASMSLTQEFLHVIHTVLLHFQKKAHDKHFADFTSAIQDFHFALEYHFTGTPANEAMQNKWISHLKPYVGDLHIPILSILKSALLKNVQFLDMVTDFPVQIIKVDLAKPKSCRSDLKGYLSTLQSPWFSVSDNDSCSLNYHTKI